MAHGGDGVARFEGKVVFVPYVIPGEEVLIDLVEDKAAYARGRPLEIIKPSPDRVEPRCRHFGTCGGCQWQHISYDRQLSLRREILQSQLTRIAHLPDVPAKPTVAAREAWNYRNHVQLHLDDEGRLGFMSALAEEVVPISECHIMHPLVWEIFTGLEVDFAELEKVSLRASTTSGEQLLILETTSSEAPEVEVDLPVSCVLLLADGTAVTYVGSPHITEAVGGRSLRISAASFFQVYTAQTERLLSTVIDYASPRGDELLLDLYCGVGTFSLNLADRVSEVVGIDSSEAAIADAAYNAQAEADVLYLHGPVEDLISAVEEEVDLAIVDPPRRGMSKEAIAAVIQKAPPRLIYVSCDPATLARDASRLIQAGYQLVEVQPVDMFPQTYHIEAVALLSLERQ
jgi:23S rRNA (uracil1939-C5)-methyltransferase